MIHPSCIADLKEEIKEQSARNDREALALVTNAVSFSIYHRDILQEIEDRLDSKMRHTEPLTSSFGISKGELGTQLGITVPFEVEHPKNPAKGGHLYIILENEADVKTLLETCRNFLFEGERWTIEISTNRKTRKVEVIPWLITDNNFLSSQFRHRDYSKTVFVGGFHGRATAQAIALAMEDLFGIVVFAGIDTDTYKYPIGSASHFPS